MPPTFDSGVSIFLNQSFQDYPSSAWTAALYLSLGTGTTAPTAITGAAGTNDSFNFVISATVSAALAPGQYRWTIQVTSAGVTEVPLCGGQGVVNVTPNFAALQTASAAQQMVTLLLAVLQEFAGTTRRSVNFAGQQFERASIKEYNEMLVYWQARLLAEQQAIDRSRGGQDPGRIHMRFDPCATGGGQWPRGWPWVVPYGPGGCC